MTSFYVSLSLSSFLHILFIYLSSLLSAKCSEEAPDEESEHQLPREKLLLLTSLDLVNDYISACDYLLYQSIVDFLIPNVLHPIPGTLTQAIRNFAKSLETWLTNTIHGYSPDLVKSKVHTKLIDHTLLAKDKE